MRILLTGENGQLGWELARALMTTGEVIRVGRDQMDLEKADSIVTTIRAVRPDLIINAAAYTAVDQAEQDELSAMAINGIAPGIMAEEARHIGAGIIHYSTDYVFDGRKDTPYTEQDVPNPLNAYGRSKLAGEQAIQAVGVPHLILRTSWVYGARGRNFLNTIRRLASERDELRIVDDQVGAPTWARLVAQATAHLLAVGRPLPVQGGLYHLTASGATSWFGFAQAILAAVPPPSGREPTQPPKLCPISSLDYLTPARRPANSRLSCEKVRRDFNLELPDWLGNLRLCLEPS